MNSIILSLALASCPVLQQQPRNGAGPPHAELHPAQADLFLAVPDVQAIVDVYGNAPVLQAVNDAGMHDFLAGLGAQLEGDPRTLLERWVERILPQAGALVGTSRAISFSVTLAGADAGASGLGLQLVASFSTPEHALAAQELALRAGSVSGTLDVPGLTGTQRFTSPALQGLELWCTTIGERLVLGGGGTTVDGLAARLDPQDYPETSLAESDLLQQAQQIFGAGSGVTVCWLAQRRSPLAVLSQMDQLGTLLDGALALPYESLPSFLDPLAGKRVLRMQLRGNRFVTEMFSAGTAAGALGGQPLQPEWLARVPADAMFVYSSALDGAKLVPQMRELFAFLGETQAPDLAAVFAGLGPGMVTYMFPINGLGAPQTHAWVEVDDAADFTAKITRLCAELAETQPGISARTRVYKVRNKATDERLAFTVTTITLPPGMLALGPMFSISPTLAEVEGKILFGLSSIHVKRELRRLYNGELDATAEDPWTAHGFEVPQDARSVVFMDWGMQIEAALSLARLLGGMLGDQLPVDLNALPDAQAMTQYLRPTFHVSRGVAGGTYRYHEASFGPETWFGITGAWIGR